jgi:exonuclease III
VPKLRIATFNINGIRSRLPALLTWLQEASPDIVCLQELKVIDSAFPIGQLVAGFSRKANLSGSRAGTGFGPVLANRLKCWFFGWHKWLEASGDKRFQRN